MRLLLRLRAILALALLLAALSSVAHADKLNGFYSGSGGLSQTVHRVLLIEFAADGTAILQQKWHDKDAQTWHAHWKRNKKTVTITYDANDELNWPRGTTEFGVYKVDVLKGVSVGEKVRFKLDSDQISEITAY